MGGSQFISAAANVRGSLCLVLGGGGFLGTQLCCNLLEAGANVRVYGRSNYRVTNSPEIDYRVGLLEDYSKLSSALAGVDYVFHLAGNSVPANVEVDRIAELSSNVHATIHLLDMCLARNINRVVFASSGGTVYGNAVGSLFNEDTIPTPISSYGINKLTIEKYLSLYNHLYGMQNVSLRIANPYGPFQDGSKSQGAVSVFIQNILSHKIINIWGDGESVRDYVYGKDVADAMIRSQLYQGSHSVFNIGSGIGRSVNDILRDLSELLNVSLQIEYSPARKIDVRTNVLQCDLALSELNWRSKADWNQSLHETCDWAFGNSKLKLIA